MYLTPGLLLIAALSSALELRQAAPEHAICRFSSLFTQDETVRNSTDFENSIFYWDGQFHKDSIGYWDTTGVTIGHTALGFATGLPNNRHPELTVSTPRNEAYHIMLLTHAIKGNGQAKSFVYSANPSDAAEIAVAILSSKLDTYLAFNETYPGFAGFLPVFIGNLTAIRPDLDWHGKVPAADNGQLVAAVYALVNTLAESERPEFQQLGSAWANWFVYALDNAKGVFMRGPRLGDVCAISTLQPGLYPYSTAQRYACEYSECLNNDPFQGELMTWFIYFSDMLNQTERDSLWIRKRPQLVAGNYTGTVVDTSSIQLGTIDYGGQEIRGRHITPITIQKGLYFNSNEQIKLLFLPYLDQPIVNRVYKNAERVRTCNSVLMGKTPGMYASAPNSTSPRSGIMAANATLEYQYVDNAGIPSAAIDQEQQLQMITPYSVFPTILFDRGNGLSWYKNMIDGKQMQTIYGSLAATRRDGSAVASFVSWESKAPTLLALLGGIVDIVRDGMKKDNIYDEFMRVVGREYGGKFEVGEGATPIMGEIVQLCLPNAKVPGNDLIDFSTCNSPASV